MTMRLLLHTGAEADGGREAAVAAPPGHGAYSGVFRSMGAMVTGESPSRTPRAERYPLVMPIRLRHHPDEPWRAGETCNVSLTGVLASFRGIALDVGSAVEMVLGLTDEYPGAGHVICAGHVVRIATAERGACRLAATIERYRTP